jgi:hypothetical protein
MAANRKFSMPKIATWMASSARLRAGMTEPFFGLLRLRL